MSDAFPKLFTVEEANALLPSLRPLVGKMLEVRDRILTIQPELESTLQSAAGNGGSRATGALLEAFNRLQALMEAIQSHGVQVKDLNTGLLDFPAERDGEIVFLCWKHGEDQVTHWHDLDSGFAGRQPL